MYTRINNVLFVDACVYSQTIICCFHQMWKIQFVTSLAGSRGISDFMCCGFPVRERRTNTIRTLDSSSPPPAKTTVWCNSAGSVYLLQAVSTGSTLGSYFTTNTFAPSICASKPTISSQDENMPRGNCWWYAQEIENILPNFGGHPTCSSSLFPSLKAGLWWAEQTNFLQAYFCMFLVLLFC